MTVSRLTRASNERSPFSRTGRRRPRPISWRFLTSERVSLSVQIWNTLGLSQPSRKAEWLKMKRKGSSSDKSRSLSRMIFS